MAKVIVQAFKEAQTSKGSTIYKCSGTIDGETDFFDMWSKPEMGKEYEGEIKETQYGKSFSLPKPGGGGFRNDPATRMEIIRQNALTNAVNRATALSQILPQEDAIQALKPSNIIQAAIWFAKYSSGEWVPVQEAKQDKPGEPAQEATPAEPPKPAVNEEANRQANQQALDQDIDPSEIPF